MRDYLTTADIQQMTGWSLQRIQLLCRSGKLPAKNASTGNKKARYLIRRTDWENFATPDNSVDPKPPSKRGQQRLDAHVKNKVI